MKTATRILASFAVPYHGSVEIEVTSARGTFVVKGDYHPDDAKVIHFVGSARASWLAARTMVRGYGRNRITLNRACFA